jgi:hypothetical protein
MPQSPTVALPTRLPLVVQPENRDETTDRDAKLLNAYTEQSESSKDQLWVFKRPGLGQTGSTLTGNGYGVYNWQGDIYAIFGSTIYKNGSPLTGVLDVTGGVYRFSQSLGTVPRLQFGNGVKSYNYDDIFGVVEITQLAVVAAVDMIAGITYTVLTSGTTNFTLTGAGGSGVGTTFVATNLGTTLAGFFVVGLTYTIVSVGTTNWTSIGATANAVSIVFVATGIGSGTGVATATQNGTGTVTTVSNFPANPVKGWAYLDGTTYVMDRTASIRGCATLNDTTDWSDVLNRVSAQIEADNGVALTKQLVYTVALGQWSTEVFYDAANPSGSPLSPVSGAKISYGCWSADSVQEMDGILFWIATNRSAAPQVLMVENLKPSVVSTNAIERLLGEADNGQVFSFAIKYEGHRFYGFTLVAKNLTMVYDMKDKTWAQWTDANGNYWPIVSTTYSDTLGRILQHQSNGKLYLFDAAYTNDDGAVFPVDIYTPNFDGGVRRRKTLSMMEFIADQIPGGVLQVRHNDWDYDPKRWSTFRKVDLNVRKPKLSNEGTFTQRAYHLRYQCDTRLRIRAVEMQMDIGTL